MWKYTLTLNAAKLGFTFLLGLHNTQSTIKEKYACKNITQIPTLQLQPAHYYICPVCNLNYNGIISL